jgi:hypothetical protein
MPVVQRTFTQKETVIAAMKCEASSSCLVTYEPKSEDGVVGWHLAR